MRTLKIIIVSIVSTMSIMAQDITGDWNGILNVQGQLRLVFHISESDSGYSATMDSPDQGAKDIPVTSVTFEDPNLEITLNALGISYQGSLGDDGKITGNFSQGGQTFPLILSREMPEREIVNRPQEPTKPYPYFSEEVSFESEEGIRLAGTLTVPATKGPFPVVILITGSGPQDRNQEIMSHKPFLVLADHLTRKGIAVLRYDDRGTAESTGKFQEATSETFAIDVKNAINFLSERKNLAKIGLIGHSEGGLIAPMVVADAQEVDFIVLMAGPGLPGDQILIKQHELLSISMGKSQEATDFAVATAKGAFDLITNQEDSPTLKSELESYLVKAIQNPLAEVPEGMNNEDLIRGQVNQLTSPWMRYFLKYDPVTSLEKVSCPVLALNGEKDVQVSVDNLEHIEKAILSGGNDEVTIKMYPNMNHLFQECETGAISEYASIEQTISPVVLDDISNWILNLD